MDVIVTSNNEVINIELWLPPSQYEGPTGIIGVLNDAFHRAGFDSLSFWAAVPSYIGHNPSPKAALALVQRVVEFLDIPCLLYTSPSPRDGLLSRMPSSA